MLYLNSHTIQKEVLGQACRGLTDGFLLLRIFSVAISVSPHVCFILGPILLGVVGWCDGAG